jgi:hypothetical protein
VGSDPVVEIFLGVQLSYLRIKWEFCVFGWLDPGLASGVFGQVSRVWALWGIFFWLARSGHGSVGSGSDFVQVQVQVLVLILARLTTCTYDVDGQLNRARYLSRARFTSKIDHVTNR